MPIPYRQPESGVYVTFTPREVDHGSRTVDGVTVRITELVWPDERHEFEIHLGDVDLTENGCLNDPPTDAQIRTLVDEYYPPITPVNGYTDANLLHRLLSTASARVGWQLDSDQLPVTCAQHPHLVVDLIDTSAAHLAALTTGTALTEAARSLQTLINDGDPQTVDWLTAELLGTVAHLANRHSPQVGHTRRALIAALQALRDEGAAWPPDRVQPIEPAPSAAPAERPE